MQRIHQIFQERAVLLKNSIIKTLREEHFKYSFLGLLWSAGPICFVAISVAFYIGHGTLPKKESLIYLSIYLFVTGFFTLLTRIFISLKNKSYISQNKYELQLVLTKLLELMNLSRGIKLSKLNSFDKIREESLIILENSDASITELEVAVDHLTKDHELSSAIKYIEIFRKYGLTNKIEEYTKNLMPKVKIWHETLLPFSPYLANVFKDRFLGISPSKKSGRPRRTGFLGRFISSHKIRNFDLINTDDVYEVFQLIYELLCGRSIKTFSCYIPYAPSFTKLSAQIERGIYDYHSLRNARMIKIKELISLTKDLLPDSEIEIKKKFSIKDLNTHLHKYSEILNLCIDKNCENLNWYKTTLSCNEKIITLYKNIYEFSDHMDYQKDRIEETKKNYAALQKRYFQREYQGISFDHKSSTSFSIKMKKNSIELTQTEKNQFIHLSAKILRNILVNRKTLKLSSKNSEEKNKFFSRELALKELANSLVIILHKYIEIDQLSTQSTIESSHASNLGSIELDMSMKTILDWSSGLVDEVQNDVPNMVYRLAQWVVNFRKEKLTSSEILRLQKNFEADAALLQKIECVDKIRQLKSLIIEDHDYKNHISVQDELQEISSQLNTIIIQKINHSLEDRESW